MPFGNPRPEPPPPNSPLASSSSEPPPLKRYREPKPQEKERHLHFLSKVKPKPPSICGDISRTEATRALQALRRGTDATYAHWAFLEPKPLEKRGGISRTGATDEATFDRTDATCRAMTEPTPPSLPAEPMPPSTCRHISRTDATRRRTPRSPLSTEPTPRTGYGCIKATYFSSRCHHRPTRRTDATSSITAEPTPPQNDRTTAATFRIPFVSRCHRS